MRNNSLNRDQSDPTRISMGGASSKISRFASRKRDRMTTLEFSEKGPITTINNSQKRFSGIGALKT
jgi:hypothetical protein